MESKIETLSLLNIVDKMEALNIKSNRNGLQNLSKLHEEADNLLIDAIKLLVKGQNPLAQESMNKLIDEYNKMTKYY